MEMLLMGACLSLLGVAVACLAFGAAAPSEERTAAPQPQPVKKTAPARFFAADPVIPIATAQARVPLEALLLQIENHVRLEQAAAESFLESPTSDLLHSRTMSPLIQ